MLHLTTLTPVPPYDLPLTLNLLARYHIAVDMARAEQREYWRTLRSGAGLALLRVVAAGTPQQPLCAVYLAAARGEIDTAQLSARVQHMLTVSNDWRPFYEMARGDDQLWRIIAPMVGARFILSESAFEALATTILEQQISLRAAHKALRWLVEWAGDFLEYDGARFYAFPTPAQVAAATVEDLLPLKITFRRMRLLLEVARGEAQGTLGLDTLCAQPDAYHALQRIKGIGHWSAALTLMRTRGIGEHILHNDVVLQAAVNSTFFGLPGRAAPQTVLDVFSRYAPYAAVAAFHVEMRRLHDYF
ncbi:MAG: DNA-3-methyladenine glycosylase 2 family protein [Chloroflexi bacterium]|nr:DNA-3-methyladenine glycosylase 2 family protein [Chloroflexota bacterium]